MRGLMHCLIFLSILCASPAWAGPDLLWLAAQPSNGPFTVEVSGTFSIPLTWYQDATATTQGSLAVLLGGGGGGDYSNPGYGGDKVTLTLTPGSRYAYKGYGGTTIGGAGYAAGADSSSGAGAGSSAITTELGGSLVAQAKGGNGALGALGGGTSSGGAVTVGGANNGGPLEGGNGGVYLTYYTDPGNFQLTTFATGNEGWAFSPTATAAVVSGVATLSEDSYNTNEYSVQKTITTRAGVMSVMIGASDGGNTGVTGQFKVTIGGTTYSLNSGSATKYEFNVPAGSTTIKFWFTGHNLYHYSMSVDDIKIPVP